MGKTFRVFKLLKLEFHRNIKIAQQNKDNYKGLKGKSSMGYKMLVFLAFNRNIEISELFKVQSFIE